MPRRTRRPSKGRTGSGIGAGGVAGRAPTGGGAALFRAAARYDAVVDLVRREVLERPRGQLLLLGGGAVTGKLVEQARELGGNQDAQILVRGVLGDFGRSKDSHWIPLYCGDSEDAAGEAGDQPGDSRPRL